MILILLLINIFYFVKSDLPVHCVWEQVQGQWTVYYSNMTYGRNPFDECESASFDNKLHIELKSPNIVVDLDSGMTGTFTLVYDQGFEFMLADKRYYANFYYTEVSGKVTSHCGQTFPGTFHFHKPAAAHWGCYKAEKDSLVGTVHEYPREWLKNIEEHSSQRFQNDYSLDGKNHGTFTTTVYPQLEGKKNQQFGKSILSFRNEHHRSFTSSFSSSSSSCGGAYLPESWDWRNVNGVNYVNPVRNQEECGSCFSFASTGMISSRTRIQSDNKIQTVFAPQKILDCSKYSQGCDGGFAYLTAGKYFEDSGFVDEECYPYKGVTGDTCLTPCKGKGSQWKYYGLYDHGYVGSYYGGCTETKMMEEVYQRGPIAVAFEVTEKFKQYKNGVYICDSGNTNATPPPPHGGVTNHAVQVVGWGVDKSTGTNIKYWIVKNSWGTDWGLDGYFWIRRGENDCQIESEAFASTPFIFNDA